MGLNRGSSLARGLERLWSEGTLTGLGPAALLERYATTGDQAAFEMLVSQHGPMVLGLCRRMLSDPRDVEDAFQAVFMILARKAGRIRDPSRLANWLYGVAYKVAARARAQAARSRARETPVAEIEDRRSGGSSLVDEVGPALDQELSRLPEKYRSAILLCYLKGRTHDQAARELACPVGTVRSRLARGRDILRRRLLERGCAPAVVLLEGGLTRRFGEAVSASLLSRTTQAAVQFASCKSAPAAAGAVALTQGVLMSMKIASLKVAAITVVVAGLGVSAGGMAASRLIAGAAGEKPARQEPPAKPQAGERSLEERMTAIEGKLDTLLSRLPAPRASVTATTPPVSGSATRTPQKPTPSAKDPGQEEVGSSQVTNRVIHELKERLKLALLEYDTTKLLYAKSGVSERELNLFRIKALIPLGGLRGIALDLEEEIEIAKNRIESCVAKAEGAKADLDIAAAVVARNTKLNQRRPGLISDEEVAKAAAELRVVDARRGIAQAELDAARMGKKQLEAKANAVEKIIELGKPLETPEPAPAKP